MDTGSDGTWSDETEHFNDTSVMDDWAAGYAGLFVGPHSSAAPTEFDDVTMWMDTDADGTIDEQQFADDFDSNQVTLTYDDNGNLTYDSVFTYVYDGWNRLRKVQRVAAGPTTTDVALYEYFADNRRSEKIVQHSGAEVVENDGGNTTVRFYYGGTDPAGSRWNIVETRNGSNQATFQYVWGTQYIDELVLIDKNLAPEIDVDCDADVLTVEEDDTDDYREGDSRYLVHQNANGDVVALTDYDPAGSTEGAVVERYTYTPYGEVTVLAGVGSGNSEFGNVRVTSTVGSVFGHQGLQFDHASWNYYNRWRDLAPAAGRFLQRDPLARALSDESRRSGHNEAEYTVCHSKPVAVRDPSGLTPCDCILHLAVITNEELRNAYLEASAGCGGANIRCCRPGELKKATHGGRTFCEAQGQTIDAAVCLRPWDGEEPPRPWDLPCTLIHEFSHLADCCSGNGRFPNNYGGCFTSEFPAYIAELECRKDKGDPSVDDPVRDACIKACIACQAEFPGQGPANCVDHCNDFLPPP